MTPDQQWTINYMRSHMNQERLEHAQLLKSAWAWLLPGIAAEVIAGQTYAPTPHWLGLTLFWVGILLVNVAWMLWDRARTAGYTSQARAAFLAQIPPEILIPPRKHESDRGCARAARPQCGRP